MPKEQLDEVLRWRGGGGPIHPDPAFLLQLVIEESAQSQRKEILDAAVDLLKSTLQAQIGFLDKVQAIRSRKG